MNTAEKLLNSDRCKLFKDISERVWHRIDRKHKLKINDKEIGVTNDIIADILEYHETTLRNFDIYARESYLENEYGSDIDIFIETYENKYRWFALQAKLLKKNKRYDTFRDSSDLVMQWDKLNYLENITGCKAYYLLYNGNQNKAYSGKDSCKQDFEETQFGCSLVEPTIIKDLANKRNGRGFISPHYSDIHPNNAQPWKVLVCCELERHGFELYTKEEINESISDLRLISKLKIDDENDDLANDKDIIANIENPNNPISNASREAGWNPSIRIVINWSSVQE
jgi:hypothetical protein